MARPCLGWPESGPISVGLYECADIGADATICRVSLLYAVGPVAWRHTDRMAHEVLQ